MTGVTLVASSKTHVVQRAADRDIRAGHRLRVLPLRRGQRTSRAVRQWPTCRGLRFALQSETGRMVEQSGGHMDGFGLGGQAMSRDAVLICGVTTITQPHAREIAVAKSLPRTSNDFARQRQRIPR
jgi:hypothetical protein